MLVPSELVTVTCTAPADPAGAIAVICVGESMVNVVAVPPKLTVAGPVNPVPVIVTLVPPVVVVVMRWVPPWPPISPTRKRYR
nr:hypothetical protein [Nocardia abscessus]